MNIMDIISKLYNYFNPKFIPEILLYTIDKGVEKFLNIQELFNVALVNNFIANNHAVNKEIKRKSIYSYFENTFISYNILEKSKLLDWNDKFIMIDYVDRIFIQDLEYPLMITVDRYKRPVLSIKYKYNNSDTYNGILTLFQRYTNDKICWVKANSRGPFLSMSAHHGMTKKDKELVIYNINSLLDGKNKIRVNNFSQSYQGDYEFDSNPNNYDEIEISI